MMKELGMISMVYPWQYHAQLFPKYHCISGLTNIKPELMISSYRSNFNDNFQTSKVKVFKCFSNVVDHHHNDNRNRLPLTITYEIYKELVANKNQSYKRNRLTFEVQSTK